MNIAISDISLYQVTQKLEPPLTSISIGAETLKSYVESIIDLAIEQQLAATIWVKLPQTKSWLNEIQRYQQQGNANHIYLCSTQKNHPATSFLQEKAANLVIPVKLTKNSWLQRESFLIIAAPNFSALVLAQWQKGQVRIESSGKRLQQPYLQMISSFQPEVINTVLAEVYNIAQNNPQTQSLAESEFTVTAPYSEQSRLLASLLLKQIQHTELVQTAFDSVSNRASQLPESTSTILALQEDFLNNLVQELRSPITHMKTALSLLESKQIKGEQRQRYLQMVSDECDRQNSLVSGLLGLLQLDSPTEIEYIRLDDFVPGIVSTYQPLARENNIQLGYTIPSNLPPVSCPATWLRQIIVNLLNNSLQFTPSQGKMFVQATLKEGYVELTVSDTGIGIETKELNKIFDGFYRTRATNKDYTGAGLGLTLVQQLVKRCGGSISVSSKVGKGTSFKILLPVVPTELI
ncbi:MAG: ATP-binding protein [Pleurocapsa sp.]